MLYPNTSSVNAIIHMLDRLGFSDATATYLTGTCGVDYLDEIAYLDGIDDVDKTIKGVTNLGGTVTTRRKTTAVTSSNNGIPVSIRAVANLKLCVYYLNIWPGFIASLLPMQSTLFWFTVIATNNVIELVSRKLQKNLRLMTKIGQEPWRRSKSTLPVNMV
jgi:hypothetical protein